MVDTPAPTPADICAAADASQETDALNLTRVPRPKMDMRLDDFSIEMEEEEGSRWFTVRGAAVERFAQMTNWDYYEAVRACAPGCLLACVLDCMHAGWLASRQRATMRR